MSRVAVALSCTTEQREELLALARSRTAEARLVAHTLGGKALMVPGAGHYPQAEFPEVTGPAITEFLNRVVAGA